MRGILYSCSLRASMVADADAPGAVSGRMPLSANSAPSMSILNTIELQLVISAVLRTFTGRTAPCRRDGSMVSAAVVRVPITLNRDDVSKGRSMSAVTWAASL